jgi:hypothetical protein
VDIKSIVKGNAAKFSFYRAGHMFYTVTVDGVSYEFPVSLDDLGTASLFADMKAITLMRYIRKAVTDGTFVRVHANRYC